MEQPLPGYQNLQYLFRECGQGYIYGCCNLKARMKGEARFMRAFHYFQLENWYGDVPFFEKDITLDEARTISRTPKAQVVDFILKELDEVAAALPVNTAYAAADRGRITKGAAIALKGKGIALR
jgi:hypothetical protein